MSTTPPASLDRYGLAERWGVSPTTIWQRTKAGQIPHLRVGARIVYPLAAIERYELDAAMANVRPPEPDPPEQPRRRRRGKVVPAAPPAARPGRVRPVRPEHGDAA